MLYAVGLIITELKGLEVAFFSISLTDRLQWGQGSVGALEAGVLCPSSHSPCNSMPSWAGRLTLIS